MLLPAGTHRELVGQFRALANPTRLRMLQLVALQGEMSVNELASRLRMSQPRVSWHLRILRTGSVVRTRRDGRLRYCSVDMDSIDERHRALLAMLNSTGGRARNGAGAGGVHQPTAARPEGRPADRLLIEEKR